MSSDEDNDYDWGAFVVVRVKVNGSCRYECIPSTWLVFDEESGRGYQTTVTFQFPLTSKLGEGIKFKENQPLDKNWPDYVGKMLLETDSQEEAFRFINNEKARVNKLSTSIEIRKFSSSSNDTSESDSEEENPRPQSGTKRKQSEQRNKNIQAKSKKLADAKDTIEESEKNELTKELHSRCSNIYEEFNTSYQNSMSKLNNTADNLQKIISTYKAKLSSTTNQDQDDSSPEDTKWTLKCPNAGPGLIELMPNTHVYVSEKGLRECKIKYTTMTTFTKGILELVFTDDAIRMCSFTGRPSSRQESEHLPTRPGLDLKARETLVSYVDQYCTEKGWLNVENSIKKIVIIVRNKLSEAYQKWKKYPNPRSRGGSCKKIVVAPII